MAGPTPPATPTYGSSASTAIGEMLHSISPNVLGIIIFIAGLMVLVLAVFFIYRALRGRGSTGAVALVITPDRKFIRVRLPAQLASRYVYYSGGRVLLFAPKNDHMLMSIDGKERLFIGFAVPVAVGGDVRQYVATSLDPSLAHDVDVTTRSVETEASTVRVGGDIYSIIDRLLQQGRERGLTLRDPVWDVELAYTIDVSKLAGALLDTTYDAVDRTLNALMSSISVESRLTRMFELMMRARQITASSWVRIILIVGIMILILMLILPMLHI